MDNLAVPNTVVEALERAGLHSLDSVLEYSNNDLIRKTGLTASQVQGLVQIFSEALLEQTRESKTLFTSSLDKYREQIKLTNWGRLTTGCPFLDKCLNGGILPAALTEVAGTSGAGKTQLCLQLSLTAQLPYCHGGLEGQSVLVLTEGSLPTGRLRQMSSSISKRYLPPNPTTSLTDNVLVHHCMDVASLTALLKHKLPLLLQQRTVKVLIIDSIAALFRSEYDSTEITQRSHDLKTVISLLQNLIYTYKVTIICTNQVTSSEEGIKPALGLIWSNSVTVRIVLHRDETVDNEAEFKRGVVTVPRTLKVQFAPHVACEEIQYYIDSNGVSGFINK